MSYAPPLTITPRLIDLISRISEALGRWEGAEESLSPRLRRENRIRSIHASLAIENNFVLSRWKPRLAWLPIETVVHHHQAAYYRALGDSDQQADAAPFAGFILGALLEALQATPVSDQVSDQATDQVNRLLAVFLPDEILSAEELMRRLKLRHKPTFRANYLRPALAAKLISMTQPDSPRSPTQRYRLR